MDAQYLSRSETSQTMMALQMTILKITLKTTKKSEKPDSNTLTAVFSL